MNWRNVFKLAALFCAVAAGTGTARAVQFDVLVQRVDARLATGAIDHDTFAATLGRRVYSNEFDADYRVDVPGFFALDAAAPTLPPGSQALPSGTPLGWDFVPMRIDDLSANLFYWNGLDAGGMPGTTQADVRFGPPPNPDYKLYLRTFDYFVDGMDAAVQGGTIGDTMSSGALHVHRDFQLDDGDGNAMTDPADGIYLLAMRLTMTGLSASLPIYIAFGTPGSAVKALDDAAVPWTSSHADSLVLLGDYNKDGTVDAADFTVWRDTQGAGGFALAADGDWSGAIGPPDYDVWRENFGKSSPISGGSGGGSLVNSVPEAASWTMLVTSLAAWPIQRRRRRAQ